MTLSFLSGEAVGRRMKQMKRDYETATRFHTHMWTVLVCHRLSSAAARKLMTEPEPGLLDAESVMSVSIGCYVCEQQLDSEVIDQPCPGEPNG